MVPITVDNLSNIDMELTNWCNADCPIGGEERLQSCFFHCGLQEQHNKYIE